MASTGAGTLHTARGGTIGGQGGKSPSWRFQKRGKWKNMGYFHASKFLKLAFLSSLMRKYVLWKGFYHNFSTKKGFSFRELRPLTPTKGLCPLDPRRGTAPWTPKVPSPPPLTIYPGAAPAYSHAYTAVSWTILFLILMGLKPKPGRAF